MSTPQTSKLTKLCVCLFSLGAIAPSIAVRSILIRRNIERSERTAYTLHSSSGGGGGNDNAMLPLDGNTDDDDNKSSGELKHSGTPAADVFVELGGGGGGAMDGEAKAFDSPPKEPKHNNDGNKSSSTSSNNNAAAATRRGGRGIGAVGTDITARIYGLCTCSSDWAVFWAVIAPWLIAFVFYESQGFATLINWTSLTVNGFVCFVLPFLIYVKARALKRLLLSDVDLLSSKPMLAQSMARRNVFASFAQAQHGGAPNGGVHGKNVLSDSTYFDQDESDADHNELLDQTREVRLAALAHPSRVPAPMRALPCECCSRRSRTLAEFASDIDDDDDFAAGPRRQRQNGCCTCSPTLLSHVIMLAVVTLLVSQIAINLFHIFFVPKDLLD
jgi:hypothetical protein